MSRLIYLDNASTTPVRKEVVRAMKPYWNKNFGNPSSITKMGVLAKKVLEESRKTVADCLERRPNEIVFTSGGTESNNLAILGTVNFLLNNPSTKLGIKKISDLHFVTSNIEHSSVTECFKELERRGAKVDYLKVNELGLVDSKDLRKLIKENTVLVSVHYANNEIGTIQPIKEIAKEVRHARGEGELPYFHTDASQAGLYLNLNVNQLGIDLMTLDAQKINGPKGVGALFVKAGTNLSAITFGGGQEKTLRPGTENIPLIVGLAKAFELVQKEKDKNFKKVQILRDYFWQKVQEKIPQAVLNGDKQNRLPNNLNFSVPGIDPEFMVLKLDEEGIVCSTKSACDRDAAESFVIRALGKSDELIKSALRFSLNSQIKKRDIDFVVKKLYNATIWTWKNSLNNK